VGAIRYVPTKDGSTIGPFPGYAPRQNTTYANSAQASYQEPLNFAGYGDSHIVNRQERKSVYVAADFGFGDVNWKGQALFNRRETENFSWRQFFPTVMGPTGRAQPVIPFHSKSNVQVITSTCPTSSTACSPAPTPGAGRSMPTTAVPAATTAAWASTMP
jgi:hypothetical protein